MPRQPAISEFRPEAAVASIMNGKSVISRMASCNNRLMHRHVNSLFLQPHGNRFLVATCVIPPPRLRDAELFRETRPTGCRRRLDVPVDVVILLGFDHREREREISGNALAGSIPSVDTLRDRAEAADDETRAEGNART
jgi:hypothetical protein